MAVSLQILNLSEATFNCSFGQGCDGLCCKNGRPPVPEHEAQVIDSVLPRALEMMTPTARKLVEKEGYLSRRIKDGDRMLRVADGWCVFFNKGCVLHTIGADDGDSYQYKPSACALFPLEQDRKNRWYIRQWGFQNEEWDLFCLNPANSNRPAADSLRQEIELADRIIADGG